LPEIESGDVMPASEMRAQSMSPNTGKKKVSRTYASVSSREMR